MNSLQDALKSAGFEVKEDEEEQCIYKLPFFQSSRYRHIRDDSDEEIDCINTIKRDMFRITNDELNGMECKKGQKIKDLLTRNFNKLYAFENMPSEDNCPRIPGLFIYFEYSYISKEFSVNIASLFDDDIQKILKDNNIPAINLDKHIKQRIIPLAFHIAKYCDDILLYIKDKQDSLINYPNIPFKFSRIQQDKKAMEMLKPYLSKLKYQPNPNSYYFIKVADGFNSMVHEFMYGNLLYYLKKATDKEMEKSEGK